jgi:hypothetical protein
MNSLRRWAAPLAGYVVVAILFFSLHAPAADAAMVSTEALLSEAQSQQERSRVEAMLDRADVRDALLGYGVDPASVQARLDALSNDEMHALAQNIESMPAAGTDPLGFLLIIFIVLLVTDILGFTAVFPFVKKRAR